MLELLRDAQQAGTRPLAVLLNSTGNRRATPARSHEQTMRKLLDCAGLDPQAVSIYSGAGGEVQVVQKPDRLFADAVQRVSFKPKRPSSISYHVVLPETKTRVRRICPRRRR